MLLNDVYLRARYYDIVFKRDISAHIDFCLALYQQVNGRPLQSMIDIACGPGYHAAAFSDRGIESAGLDLSRDMIAYARQETPAVNFIEADMSNFRFDSKVDLALCVFDGVDLLVDNAKVISHLESVRDALSDGGLYVIEQTHPRDANLYHLPALSWQGEAEGVHVEFVWGVNEPLPDIATGMAEIQMEMRINDNGQTQVIHDTSLERTLTPQELRTIVDYIVPQLHVVAYYGDFDLQQPLDWSADAMHMITVLQKRP